MYRGILKFILTRFIGSFIKTQITVEQITLKYESGWCVFNLNNLEYTPNPDETITDLRVTRSDKHVDNILGIELPLYSTVLKTAGRCDLIAEFDGVPSIIDFKTSRRLKKEEWIESYFLQTTVYSMMFEYMYKIEIPQIAILIAVDHEEPQLFVKDRGEYVNRVIEIFTAS
jgi:genome maintenance exonuclease 1